MASTSSVMNRIKMFEQQTSSTDRTSSSPAPASRQASPSPKFRKESTPSEIANMWRTQANEDSSDRLSSSALTSRQASPSPKFGREIPAPVAQNRWRSQSNVTGSNAASPANVEKKAAGEGSGARRPSPVSPSASQANSGFGRSSHTASGTPNARPSWQRQTSPSSTGENVTTTLKPVTIDSRPKKVGSPVKASSSPKFLRPSQIKSMQSPFAAQKQSPENASAVGSQKSPGVKTPKPLAAGAYPFQVKPMDNTQPESFDSVSSSRVGNEVHDGPATGVGKMRSPKSQVNPPTPTPSNVGKTPLLSPPSSEDAKKVSMPAVDWPLPSNEPKVSREDMESPNPTSISSQDENKAPRDRVRIIVASTSKSATNAPHQKIDIAKTRALRNARRLSSQKPDIPVAPKQEDYVLGINLKRSLDDASVVMKEERESSIGSASSSQRSSLSVDELQNIAMRALRASRRDDPPKSIKTRKKGDKSLRRKEQTISPKAEMGAGEDAVNSPLMSEPDESPAFKPTTGSSAKTTTVPTTAVSEGKPNATRKNESGLATTRRTTGSSNPPPPIKKQPVLAATTKLSGSAGFHTTRQLEKGSRLLILSEGRRKFSAVKGPLIERVGLSEHLRQPSIDASYSEDASVSTQDTNASSRNRRRARMAKMAAKRNSPVPNAMVGGKPSGPSAGSRRSSAKTSFNHTGHRTKSRSARLLQLSSSHRSASALLMRPETKPRDVDKAEESVSETRSQESQEMEPEMSGNEPFEKSLLKSLNVSPAVDDKSSFAASPKRDHSPTGSAFSSPRSSRVSEHPALLAKREPSRQLESARPFAASKSLPNPKVGEISRKPDDPTEDKPRKSKDSWGDNKQHDHETLSEISSPGGVKAAIDAWSSRSRENRSDRPTKASPRGAGAQGVSSSQKSDGSWSTHDEAHATSSEVSVSGSHATFISSPSSYSSSRMSVGAPGTFFRPMAQVSDFEETTNDNMLGQLTAESTDEESSTLPSHLFKNAPRDDFSISEDSELSFLLEQMQSQSDSENSGIRMLADNVSKDINDESTLIGQYHIKSSSVDNSSTTANRTSGSENEPSTLIGQSLVEPEGGRSMRRRAGAGKKPSLNHQQSTSTDSSDSQVIKWWQNTDPQKRRQQFESESSFPEKALKETDGKVVKRKDSDDLFSGLSDEDSKTETRFQHAVGSFGDDVFAGMTHSLRSYDLYGPTTTKSTDTRSSAQSGVAPPPPPPPIQTNRSDQFGTILVNGSQVVESVDSDITTSVLGGDFSKDWARREATAVIREELTAEIEDEEAEIEDEKDTLLQGGVLSARRPTETESSLRIQNGNPNSEEPPLYSGSLIEMDEVGKSSGPISDPPKNDSIFMSLGCKMMESFRYTDRLCGAPDPMGTNGLDEAECDETADELISTAQSTLSEYERAVWEKWYKQESAEHVSPVSKDNALEVTERRERAHNKLVEFGVNAKSQAENEEASSSEDSRSSQSSTTNSREANDLVVDVNSETPLQAPLSTPFTLSQRRILEKFSSTLKQRGMEVLKLNRDKKWQTRYLTVSKEVIWLDDSGARGRSGDRAQSPIGILWVKRFNAGKEYSIASIDRQGRGGLLLDQLAKVSASGKSDMGHPLSKKQQDKFRDSIAVHVEYASNGVPKCVAIRCRSTEAAHFLCTGLRVIKDVLERERAATQDNEI